MGRSIFRAYSVERVVPFAVGRRFGLTEKKGEFIFCKRKEILADDQPNDCWTRITVTGEMFSKRYKIINSGEQLPSYDRVYRLQKLLDGNISRAGGGDRLVLAKNAVSDVRENSEYSLLAGQYFEVPAGRMSRVVFKLRYEADDEDSLRLSHAWAARRRGSEEKRQTRAATFEIPELRSGGVMRLVFMMGTLDEFNSFEAITRVKGTGGRVVVDEYTIEFVDSDGSRPGSFRLIDGWIRYPGVGSVNLDGKGVEHIGIDPIVLQQGAGQ
jgi:hypothetical protein